MTDNIFKNQSLFRAYICNNTRSIRYLFHSIIMTTSNKKIKTLTANLFTDIIAHANLVLEYK